MGALVLSLEASRSPTCVAALRATSPPEPWLLFLGWLKCALYTAAALDAIRVPT